MTQLKVIIAGPGAGKTYNLTQHVLSQITSTSQHKFCAVITYTNAATEELKHRLALTTKIPPQLFIGTIHSFLIRFIIDPYAHLLSKAPVEKKYIDTVVDKYNYESYFYSKQKASYIKQGKDLSKLKFAAQAFAKNSKAKLDDELCKDGYISYDKILEQSYQIVNDNPAILKAFLNRLDFIFIDEYQDARLYKHKLLKLIIEANATQVFCIGDPLQSIFNFTYSSSILKNEPKPKSFDETPMKDLIRSYPDNVSSLSINYRSSNNIVDLINRFIQVPEHKQESNNGCNGIPVIFIDEYEEGKIFEIYDLIQRHFKIEGIHNLSVINTNQKLKRDLILTRDWETLALMCTSHGIVKLNKKEVTRSSYISDVSKIILAALGVKKSEVLLYTKGEVNFRKFCFEIVRTIKSSSTDLTSAHIINLFETKFNCLIDKSKSQSINVTNRLKSLGEKEADSCANRFYSAIHSSKGLEATSVLLCSKSENEFTNWLNFSEAQSNLKDSYRLGYVGISRARDLLCLASLKPLNKELLDSLKELNITFSSEILSFYTTELGLTSSRPSSKLEMQHKVPPPAGASL